MRPKFSEALYERNFYFWNSQEKLKWVPEIMMDVKGMADVNA
jgi:hypothetical protein